MQIREIYIKNFGKFHKKEISFLPGINLIYGGNESGKSTLHEFLRGMFFGLQKFRGRAAKTDSFHLYQPWEDKSTYGGIMRFVCDEKIFCLERDFQTMEVSLSCETDGERLSPEQGDLDFLLGNISKTVFDNTISFSQLKTKTETALIEEIKNYIANFRESNDGELNLTKAIQILLSKKKDLVKEIEKEEEKRLISYREIQGHFSYIEKELDEIETKIQMTYRELEEIKAMDELEEKDFFQKNKIALWMFFLVIVLVNIGFLLDIKFFLLRLGFAGLAAFLGLAEILSLIKVRKKRKSYSLSVSETIERKKWTLLHLQESKKEKEEEYGEVKEAMDFLPPLTEEEKRLYEEKKAIELAIEHIELLSDKIQKGIGKEIENLMSKILKEVTLGKYEHLHLGEDFSFQLENKWQRIPEYFLSVGTLHLVYFTFRMAVSRILCKEEILPLFLDEAFSMYDDERVEMLFRWLSGQKRQVLIFTCQKREEQILLKSGIPFHKITL
ncbi:MAG TPA: AAA family ATPase [Lachnospiraceae bacterium]